MACVKIRTEIHPRRSQVTSSPALSDTEQAVLAAVYEQVQTTKPELAQLLSFSQPTIGTAVSQLEGHGLISRRQERKSGLGRAAAIYGLSETAGWLLGIDVGTTRVSFLARTIAGEVILSERFPVSEDTALQAKEVEEVLRSEVRRIEAVCTRSSGPLRGIGIALPRVISTYVREQVDSRDPTRHTLGPLVAALGTSPDIPILLENNVNCAALAESIHGAAAGRSNFVYIQVGIGIGAGIMAGGRLIRGAAGAAGEIALIPLGTPHPTQSPGRDDELEARLGANGLLQRAREAWDDLDEPAPESTPELFERARAGSSTAQRLVRRHAADTARLIAVLCAVLNPESVVLGGGMGQNALLFEEIERILPAQIEHIGGLELRRSELGESASVVGAVDLTLDFVLRGLLAAHHVARIDDHQVYVMQGSPSSQATDGR